MVFRFVIVTKARDAFAAKAGSLVWGGSNQETKTSRRKSNPSCVVAGAFPWAGHG